MNGTRKAPALLIPACATVVALLDLVVCLMVVKGNSGFTEGLIWSEAVLIGIAVIQWVVYFRQYIDFRIAEALQDRTAATQTPA